MKDTQIAITQRKRLQDYLFRHQKWVFLSMGILIAFIISWQQYSLHSYNNFTIFSASFHHLRAGLNLYSLYPNEYYDLFLYNPSFAIIFAPFAAMPTWFGMFCWTSLSMTLYLLALNYLPVNTTAKLAILIIAFADCVNALQHMQVNHIDLAFMLLTFTALRKNRPVLAAMFTVIVLFIKVYPAAVGLCFLFFPQKFKYLAACLFWSIVLFSLPLIFISFPSLLQQYQNWFASLTADKSIEEMATSLSLLSINYQWLKHPINPTYIQLTGLAVLLLPLLIKRSCFNSLQWQLRYLSAILIFVIVFNHAAESATYLLAVVGAGLWYVTSSKSVLDKALLTTLIIGTVFTITDLFPYQLKIDFVQPYSIRVVPCVLVWIKIIIDLLTFKTFHENATTLPVGNHIAPV